MQTVKSEHDCHEMSVHFPMRHILMPVDQIVNGICMQCNILLNEHNSISQSVFANNNQMRTVRLLKKFNPIPFTNHVHLGTKLKVLIALFKFSIKNPHKSNSLLSSSHL